MPIKSKRKRAHGVDSCDTSKLKQEQALIQRLEKQKEAEVEAMVNPIYASGLADAYKYFLQQLYREGVRFNVYEFAAQKILKFEKLKRDKARKLQLLEGDRTRKQSVEEIETLPADEPKEQVG